MLFILYLGQNDILVNNMACKIYVLYKFMSNIIGFEEFKLNFRYLSNFMQGKILSRGLTFRALGFSNYAEIRCG